MLYQKHIIVAHTSFKFQKTGPQDIAVPYQNSYFKSQYNNGWNKQTTVVSAKKRRVYRDGGGDNNGDANGGKCDGDVQNDGEGNCGGDDCKRR